MLKKTKVALSLRLRLLAQQSGNLGTCERSCQPISLSGIATIFFSGGAKFGDLGTEFPQWGPGAEHPEADDCIIIMCRNLTTKNFNYFMQLLNSRLL